MAQDVLSHAVTGDGPPLLLLNGGLMTYAAWEPLAGPLARACRLVRCDFRGQLFSPGTPPETLEGHADDLVRLLDHLGLASVHVAGASFGALVGIILAAKAPSRVRSLIAMTATEHISAGMAEGGAELADALQVAIDGGDGGRVLDIISESTWSPEYRAANAAMLAARRQAVSLLPRSWFVGLKHLMASLGGLDLRPLLPQISCPTLVIGGDADRTFPVEHSHALAAGIPGARLDVIAGGSHGLVLEHAARVIDLTLSFVTAAESKGAGA